MLCDNVTYEEAKTMRDTLEANIAKWSEILAAYPRGPMGLTPDHLKQTPEWQHAKAECDKAFEALRRFNRVFVKRFRREIQAERRKRFPAGPAAEIQAAAR